jgi:multidrug efflux pump subunit AcrB
MRLWEFAVRRWQFTLLVFALLVALGVSSWRNIARSDDPIFPIPVVSIVAVYPGADPSDVERLIVDPIEDAVNGLDDVKNIDSDSRDGLAVMRVEFSWDTDPDKKYDEVVREINALRADLPQGLALLEVRKTSSGLVNIVQLALVSESASYRELESIAKDLKDAIERVPGVRKSETWAYPQPEVRVSVDLDRLSRLGVSVDDVASSIRASNANLPGGAVDAGARKYNLKATGSYDSLEEIASTVIGAHDGRVVRVRDVADVRWATEEESYTGRFKGERAVFVTANEKDGQNVFAVRDGIYAVLDDFQRHLPAGVRIERAFDQSGNVAHRLDQLGHDFAIAIALVLITLLPLGLRASVVVMISIPLSLAIGLTLLHFTGFSLNQLSIAGFVLALGLLVDDSIVVVENISRYLRLGYDRVSAAIAATDQIALAVLGCTAALLFAFLPLLFLPGGPGLYIRSLPASVLYTIFASLFVALTVIPFLSSRLLPRGGVASEGNAVLRALKHGIERVYGPALRKALAWPKTTLLAGFAVFALALALVPVIGFSLFPSAGIPQFMIDIDAPEGASLAETDRALRFVEGELAKRKDIRYWFANLGRGNPRVYYNVIPKETRANIAQVYAELADRDPKRGPQVLDELRAAFRDYPAARISVKTFENGPPIAAPIAIRVSGPELDQLRELAARVEGIVRGTPGTRDVDNPVRLRRTDLDLGIDTDKAALLGVSPIMADRTVRLAIAGYPVTRFREADGDEYDVTLRLPMRGGRQTLAALDEIQIGSASGAKVPLRQLSNPQFRTAPALIQRHDREREVTVTAYPRTGYNTDRITRAIVTGLGQLDWPAGYAFVAAGEAEARAESFGGLGGAILIASFGILAVLVLEFGSFRSMLIVAGVVPLGVVGALFALFVSGNTLSFTAAIGMIALVGIEIKNSILLVDFTNQLRAQGVALDDAIEQAGEIRFLPILLTSATAIGGLMPLALQGSGIYSPLAIVIIGGLISSTLLARLVTPVMYKLLPPTIALASREARTDGIGAPALGPG